MVVMTSLTTTMTNSVVDGHCPLKDAQLHSTYTCTLNRVDIGKNENKFYIIQVLSRGSNHYVWTRWGRVGSDGQNSLSSPFDNVSSAVLQFRKIFKDKTKLDWDRRTGTPVDGCYTYMQLDAQNTNTGSQSGQIVVNGVNNMIPTTDPNLDDRVSKVIHSICDKQMMQQAMVAYSIDVQKLPLGKLSREQLDNAERILKDIEEAIRQNASVRELERLSSSFWTLVPQATKLNQRPPVISKISVSHDASDQEKKTCVQEWANILEGMRNIQVAVGAIQNSTTLYQLYQALDVNMSPCTKDEKELLELMLKGTTSNHGMRLELLDAVVLDKASQNTNDVRGLFQSLGDHRMLFHGTKSSNIAGILKEGFRVPRADQVVNGSALGRGIYYADCCTKSAQYCGLKNGEVGFMFVCEVALGTKQVVFGAHFDTITAPFQSRLAKGRRTVNYVENDGVWYPCGPVLPKRTSEFTTFEHNEINIPDTNQYRFRYLLVIKRHPN